jgi:hypothetical protein
MIEPPSKDKDLINFSDTVWIKILHKWRPQISARNCNKAQLWNLLTSEKESTFHALERKKGNQKEYFLFDYPSSTWRNSKNINNF